MALINKSKNIKVGVALSGGVDSSVACALLKKQGYGVVGIFMNLWLTQGGCCSIEDQERARKVAEILKIPFYVVNFSEGFKNKVVEHFLAELKKGKTPNPCVVCNKEIKFGLLLQKAKTLGCDYLATGHYAQIKNLKLLRARNLEKDQTYFLWRLKQGQLKHILFPIGEIESKQKVRDLAKKFGLPTYKTLESNDICFLQDTNINEFLNTRINTNYLEDGPRGSGDIVDFSGQVLGKHKGLWFYTIGQRKGIGLSGGPWFVIDKIPDPTPRLQAEGWGRGGTLVVSKNEKDLLKTELITKEVNWISGKEPKLPCRVSAKIRYGSPPAFAKIYKLSTTNYKLVFTKPQRAITPGQSIVFYKGSELLGGGIIQ